MAHLMQKCVQDFLYELTGPELVGQPFQLDLYLWWLCERVSVFALG